MAASGAAPRRWESRRNSGSEGSDRAERFARLVERVAEARAWARAEYWNRWDPGVTDPGRLPAWLMVDAPHSSEEPLLDVDLAARGYDGNNRTVVEVDLFDPGRVYPGATLLAGRPGAVSEVQVLRTELRLTSKGAVAVAVTVRQTALQSLRESLGDFEPEWETGRPRHPQSLVSVPGHGEAEVDAEIAPLIKALWQHGIDTALSCQASGSLGAYMWVAFPTAEDALAFLDLAVGEYVEEDESMYQRAAGVWDIPDPWRYSIYPRDQLLMLEPGPMEGSLQEHHRTGQAAWDFSVSIRFPRTDLPAVERAFAVDRRG